MEGDFDDDYTAEALGDNSDAMAHGISSYRYLHLGIDVFSELVGRKSTPDRDSQTRIARPNGSTINTTVTLWRIAE